MPTGIGYGYLTIRFYSHLLGFEVVEKAAGGRWAWLRHEDAERMLNTFYDDGDRPDRPDLVRLWAHQDMGLFMGCPDIDGITNTCV